MCADSSANECTSRGVSRVQGVLLLLGLLGCVSSHVSSNPTALARVYSIILRHFCEKIIGALSNVSLGIQTLHKFTNKSNVTVSNVYMAPILDLPVLFVCLWVAKKLILPIYSSEELARE